MRKFPLKKNKINSWSIDTFTSLSTAWYFFFFFLWEHLSLLFFLNFCRKFEDIFDVDHFIDYLKDDVRIVRDIPEWFTDKSELFTSIRFDSLFMFLI